MNYNAIEQWVEGDKVKHKKIGFVTTVVHFYGRTFISQEDIDDGEGLHSLTGDYVLVDGHDINGSLNEIK